MFFYFKETFFFKEEGRKTRICANKTKQNKTLVGFFFSFSLLKSESCIIKFYVSIHFLPCLAGKPGLLPR